MFPSVNTSSKSKLLTAIEICPSLQLQLRLGSRPMDVSVSQIFGGVDVQLMKVLGGTHILQFAGTNILHVSQIFCIFSNPLEQFESSGQTFQWIAVIAEGIWMKQRLMIQLRNRNLVLSRSVTAVTCRKYSCEWLRRWGKDIWTEGVFSTSGDGIGRSSDERFSGYAEERRWWEVKLIFFNWSNWIVLFFVENLKTEPCEISQC